jgi:hypothetical protein
VVDWHRRHKAVATDQDPQRRRFAVALSGRTHYLGARHRQDLVGWYDIQCLQCAVHQGHSSRADKSARLDLAVADRNHFVDQIKGLCASLNNAV